MTRGKRTPRIVYTLHFYFLFFLSYFLKRNSKSLGFCGEVPAARKITAKRSYFIVLRYMYELAPQAVFYRAFTRECLANMQRSRDPVGKKAGGFKLPPDRNSIVETLLYSIHLSRKPGSGVG